MHLIVDPIERLSPATRPPGKAIGFHRWSDLLFVHWRLPAEEVAALLPSGLTLDTWQGDAWVGLVPFHMSGVRPWWSPEVPGVSSFHETNVRTYVHRRGESPGVWFFSLEASSSLAVLIGRRRWGLNYQRATMQIARRSGAIAYRSRRHWPGRRGVGVEIEAEIGGWLGENDAERPLPPGRALPGTLEHFLIERYSLYVVSRRGRLQRGQVHHAPYPLREAKILKCHDTLFADTKIRPATDICHTLFSPGVAVEIFSPRDCE